MRPVRLVFSCEHGGADVPARYAHLFESASARQALASHRGWDEGAADLASALAQSFGAPLVVQRATRLLVECNRSSDHPRLWSEFSRDLSPVEKERVLFEYWSAHRDAVRRVVADQGPGLVVHLGIHSFTPIWKGRARDTDIGLLYDPARHKEGRIARAWRNALQQHPGSVDCVIHRNRPYRGWTDGLVTTLRGEMPESRYAGIELEVSQALMPATGTLIDALTVGLEAAVDPRGS